MESERMMVLRMLEEGKITAEEAAALLEALEGEAKTAGRREDGGPGLRSVLGELLEALGEGLPLFFAGVAHEVKDVTEGEFPEGEGPVEVRLSATHRVTVQGWDEPGYRVEVTGRVRGHHEEEARRMADAAGSVRVEGARLEVARRPGVRVVSVEAWLPKDRVYDLKLKSANGRVELYDLECDQVRAATANGKICLVDVTSSRTEAKSANGAIEVRGTCGDLDCRTANGSIRLACSPVGHANWHLKTLNGSISAELDPTAGYDVDAVSSFGKVLISLQGEVVEEEKKAGRTSIRLRTRDFAEKARRVTISARTGNGAITLG